MNSESSRTRNTSLVASAILLVIAILGLWVAVAVLLPSSEQYHKSLLYPSITPGYVTFAYRLWRPLNAALIPLCIIGLGLVIGTILGRRLPKFAKFSRSGIHALAVGTSILAIYTLSCGGLLKREESGSRQIDTRYYDSSIIRFGLIEAAGGRFASFRDTQNSTSALKIDELGSASELSLSEKNDRRKVILLLTKRTTDVAVKKKLYATLVLLEPRFYTEYDSDSHTFREDIVSLGAPKGLSNKDTLQWIESNLSKDGWDPLPMFRLKFSLKK